MNKHTSFYRYTFLFWSILAFVSVQTIQAQEEDDSYESFIKSDMETQYSPDSKYISPELSQQAEDILYKYRKDGKKLKKLKDQREKKEAEEEARQAKYHKPLPSSAGALLRIPYKLTIGSLAIPPGFYLADLEGENIILKRGATIVCTLKPTSLSEKQNGSSSAYINYQQDQATELVLTKGSRKAVVQLTKHHQETL